MRRTRASPTGKSIYDPVHGPISLDGLALDLIGTVEFQRLWGIRQTGFAHLVFPGANHTRLEHSLGAFWVARRIAERLDLPADRQALVEAGGLLHDLGHGPFSHTLEPSMIEVLGYGHERRSRSLIVGEADATPGSRVPETLERHGLSPRNVADLIDPPASRNGGSLLSSLLHGAIDADRLDYLQRDAYYTGVAHGAVDSVRLLDTVRVHRRRLAFAAKGRSAVEGFLVGRALMYSAVYYHKTVRAAELMAQAALERAHHFPESARPRLEGTDGDLLYELGHDAEATSRRLAERLRRRHLHKLVQIYPALSAAATRRWSRLATRPAERRRMEDEISDRLGAPPASVLFDLAGLAPRDRPDEDGRGIALVGERTVDYPFRGSQPWGEIARGPPTLARVSIYAAPQIRSPAGRWLRRNGGFTP